MAVLKRVWKEGGRYYAIVDLGDREILLIQVIQSSSNGEKGGKDDMNNTEDLHKIRDKLEGLEQRIVALEENARYDPFEMPSEDARKRAVLRADVERGQ